jgi:hemerythrin-like domain-containing protein
MTELGPPANAIAEPAVVDPVDPLFALLDSLTREGKVVAAFESAHTSFLRYQEAAIRVASTAMADGQGIDNLRKIFESYVDLFHAHHLAEEGHLFPTLRRVEPALALAVDQLLSQHSQLAAQLDVVSRLVRALDSGTEADAVLLQELLVLQDIVIEHLAFEESVTVPVISSWTEWPVEGRAR